MGSSQIQGDLWSVAAADWAELQEPNHLPLFEAMLDAAQVGENTVLLDVGCGGGTSSMTAASRGARVNGLDAAEGLINLAKSRLPDGDFRVGDMEELPFDDNTFDVVFAANSIQYAADRVNALREFKRVCRPGGYIVAGLFGQPEDVEFRIIIEAVGNTLPEPPPGEGPFGLSQPGKLQGLFEAADMRVVTHAEVNCPMIYPDLETFWRAARSGGPAIGAIRKVGEEKVKQAMINAAKSLQADDGRIVIQRNHFQYVAAQLDD